MIIRLYDLGRLPYTDGLAVMQQVVAARQAGRIGDTLLLMEHEPVLTLGRNSTRANILATDKHLAARNVTLHTTNRGGEVTYHGPGQLVGYPIVDLRGDLPGRRGVHLGPVDFVRLVEAALIFVANDFGIPAQRVAGRTGVWTLAGGTVAERKLAAIGIHVSHAVTSHGFALNVTTDLRDFDLIVPCGITDRAVTSLELESPQQPPPTLQQAADSAARNLARVLGRQVLAASTLEELLVQSHSPETPRHESSSTQPAGPYSAS